MTGNKGEWSEFYACLKILCDGHIAAADKNSEAVPGKFFSVRQLIKTEAGNSRTYEKYGEELRIMDRNASTFRCLPAAEIAASLPLIFQEIQNGKSSFPCPTAEEIIRKLEWGNWKAGSSKKADIQLVMDDRLTAKPVTSGFSVKSMTGGPASLLNASKQTNFVFKALNLTANPAEINALTGSQKIRDRINKMAEKGAEFVFEYVNSRSFDTNLRKIDSRFPEILAGLLLLYYRTGKSSFRDLVPLLAADNSLKLSRSDLEYKIKNLLFAFAFGMMPGSIWSGRTSVQGGYLIVKPEGEIVCFHLYNAEEFRDYLYENTGLETASSSKHDFGTIYSELSGRKFKLNLQIRFSH